jgi:peroxiredoxin
MIELGELERHHADFASRNTRVVAVSIEDLDKAKQTQSDFPHLIVLADYERGLSNVVEVIHSGSKPDGEDTSAPTTILIDRGGAVRWLFRPTAMLERLSPDEVLRAIDAHIAH